MNKESIQTWKAWSTAAVVVIAVLVGLSFKGVSGATVSDAVKDIGKTLLPILSAFVAARVVIASTDPAGRHERAGEESLQAVQKKHSGHLSGPKASRENYDPENPGKAGRYLFFQRDAKGSKAQFIPVLPLREGVIEIRVSKTTLITLGAKRDAPDLDQQKLDMQKRVSEAVEAAINRSWKGKCEILEQKKHGDIAILVDFDESNLRLREFKRAVTECAEAALGVLLGDRS